VKHLLRLYPRRWRRRYAVEVEELVKSHRLSLPAVVDLLRGALDERLRRGDALVFVPSLGFRPLETRVLQGASAAERDGTTLHAVALAASPEVTDVIVEWVRPSDAAKCAPGPYLSAVPPQPPELGSAKLAYGGVVKDAQHIHRGSFAMGADGIHAFHTIRFPAVPRDVSAIELCVREGASTFALSLRLATAATRARTLDAFVAHGGVTVRATSVAWHADELHLGVEVTSSSSVGQVGTPMPPQPVFRGVGDEVRRARASEMRRVFGSRFDPLRLELPDGTTVEELRRIFAMPLPTSADTPIVQRFVAAFPAPSRAREVTLVVPFVELSDRSQSASVDLRVLPVEVALGPHSFTVVAAEPYGADTKVLLQLHPAQGERIFVQPASFLGSGGSYSWNREADGRVWFAGPVGEPPVVRFIGTVERVTGPWRIPISLTP
jgi:hypothetical protein